MFQLIIYNDDTLQAVQLSCDNYHAEHEIVQLMGFGEEYAHSCFTGTATVSFDVYPGTCKKAELDPTTMQRIAKYNLNEENQELMNEIANQKKELCELEKKTMHKTLKLNELSTILIRFARSDYENLEDMIADEKEED